MAILKKQDIRKMSSKEIEDKLKDLKMELVKSKVLAAKGGKLKIKEIKRTIARLLTINRQNNGNQKISISATTKPVAKSV